MGMKYRVLLFLKLKGVLKQFRSIFCMYVFSTKFQAETDLNMNIIIWGFLHKKLFFFFLNFFYVTFGIARDIKRSSAISQLQWPRCCLFQGNLCIERKAFQGAAPFQDGQGNPTFGTNGWRQSSRRIFFVLTFKKWSWLRNWGKNLRMIFDFFISGSNDLLSRTDGSLWYFLSEISVWFAHLARIFIEDLKVSNRDISRKSSNILTLSLLIDRSCACEVLKMKQPPPKNRCWLVSITFVSFFTPRFCVQY